MALYFLYQRVARREGSAPAVRNASTAGGAEALGGDVQGRAPVLVGCVDLRPQLQQQADLVLVGPAGAFVKGAPAVVVGGVDVLAALHEPADEFVGAGCDVQGRGPAALAGADLAVGQFGEGLFDPALLHERAQVLGQGRAQAGHGRSSSGSGACARRKAAAPPRYTRCSRSAAGIRNRPRGRRKRRRVHAHDGGYRRGARRRRGRGAGGRRLAIGHQAMRAIRFPTLR